MASRRKVLLGMSVLASAGLTGCAVAPKPSSDQSRTYCLKVRRTSRTVCTPERIPSANAEAQAKRFDSVPGLLTVYVVRSNLFDSERLVSVTLNRTTQIGTLPNSLIRMRLTPSDHVIEFDWDGRTNRYVIHGSAGDVRFVDLTCSWFPFLPSYGWSDIDQAGARVRARKSRLVADIENPSLPTRGG